MPQCRTRRTSTRSTSTRRTSTVRRHRSLHAPAQTVVSGYYDGSGHLFDLSVTPAARKKDVVFAGCVERTS